MPAQCSVVYPDGSQCTEDVWVKSRALCVRHNHRVRRYGSPFAGGPPRQRRVCPVPGCGQRPYYRKGLCAEHYADTRRCSYVDPDGVRCPGAFYAKGLCQPHHGKAKRNGGDPSRKRAPNGAPLAHFREHLRTPSPLGCKLWPYGKDSNGYGTVELDGRTQRVHSLACADLHGPMPEPGMHASHSCGNPTCWAYEHLTWKPPVGNARDKVEHGTQQRGERVSTARLTEPQVLEILDLLTEGRSKHGLARQYGVNRTTIHHIAKGETWKHLPRPDRKAAA